MVRGYGIVASEEVGTATITDVGSGYSNGYHYYHQNEHGDIEYITGKDGKIENAYTYDAFGNITNSTELVRNRYTYNGEQYDQVTQQYYLRARYYNPLVGRFTQEDVYRGDGLNLYAYCGNNPVMYVDPSGYSEQYGTGSEGGSESNYILYNKTHKDSLPKPKGTGPNGGRLQSHHGLQQEWCKENLSQYGYDASLAPTVTIETGKGMPHTSTTNAQNARKNARVAAGQGKWSSSLQEELSYIVPDFRKAGFSDNTINSVLEQQYHMLDKLGVSYERIKY